MLEVLQKAADIFMGTLLNYTKPMEKMPPANSLYKEVTFSKWKRMKWKIQSLL